MPDGRVITWGQGVTKRGDSLTFDPRVPAGWKEFEVELRFRSARYRCRVENPDGVEHGVAEVSLDGTRLPGGAVPLRDDAQEHSVRVVMGRV